MAERNTAAPITLEDWAACLSTVLSRRPSGMVLAVSGGPDSICMMRLTAQLLRQASLPPLTVATVDHGLRPGSAAETAFVLAEAAALGLPAQCLAWTGVKPVAALQETARTARYGLLAELCVRCGADHLLTAHTRDDQAETILFRLLRGSGAAGLAGMRPLSRLRDGITHARPLLGMAKARLVATCQKQQWPTVDDPSNHDSRFARTRLRRLLPILAAEGFTGDRFARVAERSLRADEALRYATEQIAADVIRPAAPDSDVVQIDAKALATIPAEFAIRLLGRALRELGHERPVRLDRLESATAALLAAAGLGTVAERTLHGCLLVLTGDGLLTIRHEGARRRGVSRCPDQPEGPARLRRVKLEHRASLGNESRHPYIDE